MAGRPETQAGRSNRRLMFALVAVVFGMVGLSFAAVPLYDIFCRVTGLGGTTQVAEAASGEVLDRVMRIRFFATTAPGLPWEFEPEQREITVRIGEPALAYFRATNTSDQPLAGMATYNVTPFKVGSYFVKTQCFCFDEQVLAAGQTVDMPVYFYVDPALADDPNMNEVRAITLGYKFFPAELDEADPSRPGQQASLPARPGDVLASAAPDASPAIGSIRQEVR